MKVLFAFFLFSSTGYTAGEAIQWQPWKDNLFSDSAKNHKLVILDLEAVWCHWCHVMDEKTYSDPNVIKEIEQNYIAVRVDQDARPDLSNRYEDYGWPATIVFDSHGRELAKRAGYLAPDEMLRMLQAFVKDPTPGPSAGPAAEIKYAAAGKLPEKVRAGYSKLIKENYDTKLGGWDAVHKFLDIHLAEFYLTQALQGDATARRNYELALDSQLAILDPVWGGFYQYSAESDWKHPHYEKIISIQADNLRMYSLALRDPKLDSNRAKKYQAATEKVISYLDTFFAAPGGGYYVSQDADVIPGQHSEKYFSLSDRGRRKIGIPRVDHHIYSRENGWIISALLDNYAATGDARLLAKAKRTTDWIIKNRKVGALFRHDEPDKESNYLGDSLAMANAFLRLYVSTGDRSWLALAETTANAILGKFENKVVGHGLLTTVASKGQAAFSAHPQFEENVTASRLYNQLSYYTGRKEFKEAADRVLPYLASSQFDDSIYASAAVLTVDDELTLPPVHIVVVGDRTLPQTQILFAAGLKFPAQFKILELWDKREGPMPNPDVTYPELAKPAAFVCADHRCSFPAFLPEDISIRVRQLTPKTSKQGMKPTSSTQ